MTDIRIYNADRTEALPETGVFGQVVEGAQRIGERVAYELLLRQQSVTGRSSGTLFVDTVRGASTGFDVTGSFTTAANQVLHRLAAQETTSTPLEEQATGIFLMGMQVAEGVIDLDVKVITRSNTVVDSAIIINLPAI